MNFEELASALEKNADNNSMPNPVEIPGIGTLHVRRRTILEYERMADLRKALAEGKGDKAGILGMSLARLLCDEQGNRFTTEQELRLGTLLAGQPEEVMNLVINASDGEKKPEPVTIVDGKPVEGEPETGK